MGWLIFLETAMKLTTTELRWLKAIVKEIRITMRKKDVRKFKLYLAHAIIASR